ncbi:MAG TPA: PqiC family protein [Burkholderiales bacterium]|nr:PqiC family protein [Burkholderiales bacterium]
MSFATAVRGQGPGVRRHAFAVSIALIALAGCGGAPSPKTNFYSLSVEAAPVRPESATGPAAATRVLVTRVAIPGVVDRPQMVSRTASNSVEIHDFHRWAEPLQEAIPRVIAGNLAQQLGPGHAVSTSPLPGLPPDVRIAVDVQKFEATMGTGVAVDVLWSVRPGVGEARVGRSTVEEPAAEAGHAGIAAAYSRALAAVARDIAVAASALPVSRPAKPRP